MTEPIPNWPLKKCNQLIERVRESMDMLEPDEGYTGESLIAQQAEIIRRLEQLADVIQRDQSGEI